MKDKDTDAEDIGKKIHNPIKKINPKHKRREFKQIVKHISVDDLDDLDEMEFDE